MAENYGFAPLVGQCDTEGALATAKDCRTYRQKLRERALDLFGRKCRKCETMFELEFAHLKPTRLSGAGRGLSERYLDILKNPDSYTLLCKPCHKEFDDSRLDEVPF